jgi:hypothetical protein
MFRAGRSGADALLRRRAPEKSLIGRLAALVG